MGNLCGGPQNDMSRGHKSVFPKRKMEGKPSEAFKALTEMMTAMMKTV